MPTTYLWINVFPDPIITSVAGFFGVVGSAATLNWNLSPLTLITLYKVLVSKVLSAAPSVVLIPPYAPNLI